MSIVLRKSYNYNTGKFEDVPILDTWKLMEQRPARSPERSAMGQIMGKNLLGNAIHKYRQEKEDKGYTAQWLKDRIKDCNTAWRKTLKEAVEKDQRELDDIWRKYDLAKKLSFDYHFSEREQAELQYLQTLIKTRILNESAGQAAPLVDRIVQEFIHTQKGARAITFLAVDSEVGKALRPYYTTAAENAKTAAEQEFEADKERRCSEIYNHYIIPYMFQIIVGKALLEKAEQQVAADAVNEYYFSTPTPKSPSALGQNEEV